jgi:hypothetical protein
VAAADRRRRARRRSPSAAPCSGRRGATMRSSHPRPGLGRRLLAQPAAWTVPLAFRDDGRRLRCSRRPALPGARRPLHGPAAHPEAVVARPAGRPLDRRLVELHGGSRFAGQATARRGFLPHGDPAPGRSAQHQSTYSRSRALPSVSSITARRLTHVRGTTGEVPT